MNIILTDGDIKDSFNEGIENLSTEHFETVLGDELNKVIMCCRLVEYKGILGHKIFKNRLGVNGVISYSELGTAEETFQHSQKLRKKFFKEMGMNFVD